MIDLHCHILPELDDGPETMATAIEMCLIAVDDGIRTIVATPHMLDGMFAVTPAAVHKAIGALKESLEQERIPLEILPGADVHVDRDLPGYLGRKEIITVADKGRHLMVEFPQDVFPQEMGELLFQVQLKGVTPIITHPERNGGVQQNPGMLAELIEAGNLTQITAGSLTGIFGAKIQECALGLLRSNMVHLVASDAHNTTRRSPRLSEARLVVEREAGEQEAALIFVDRPKRILEGAYVDPPEPRSAGSASSKRRGEGKKKRRGFWRGLLNRNTASFF